MARNNYQQANIEIMNILQKYDITSALILLGSQTDYEGHIQDNIYSIAGKKIDIEEFIKLIDKIKK